jgi:hypothetical protein
VQRQITDHRQDQEYGELRRDWVGDEMIVMPAKAGIQRRRGLRNSTPNATTARSAAGK